MKYYKSLRPNMTSWYDPEFKWELGLIKHESRASESHRPCDVGLHFAKSVDAALFYGRLPARIFEAVPHTDILGENKYKVRVGSGKITKELKPEWLDRVNSTMAGLIEEIRAMTWFDNNCVPEKGWRLFENRDAATKEVGENYDYRKLFLLFHKTIKGVVEKNSLHGLALAVNSSIADLLLNVMCAKPSFVLGSIRDEELNIQINDVVDNPILYVTVVILEAYGIKTGLVDTANKYWDVWKKGYGLFADIDGSLLAYKHL